MSWNILQLYWVFYLKHSRIRRFTKDKETLRFCDAVENDRATEAIIKAYYSKEVDFNLKRVYNEYKRIKPLVTKDME